MLVVGGHARSGKRCSGGWSLVEILVALACFALLASILFPIFARARLLAYQTKCSSNLEQLANAFHTYAQDWNDRWPAPGGVKGDWSYWSQTSPSGGINPYLKQRGSRSVFCCPLMPDWKSFLYAPRTYCMNSYLRDMVDVEYPTCCSLEKGLLTGISPNRIAIPGKTVLLFEGLPLTYGWESIGYYIYIYRCCNWTGVKGYNPELRSSFISDAGSPWHGRVSNYVYCDGHLRARPPGRCFVKPSGPTDLSTHNEMYEWYVDKAKFETQVWPTHAKLGVPYE